MIARIPTRRGVVLVITLVIISMLAVTTVGLQLLSRSSLAASRGQQNNLQARQAAMCGIRRAIALRQMYPADADQWMDNPNALADQPVFEDDDTERGWYFTVYAPGDDETLRYGVIDEASKININTADETLLAASGLLSDEQIDCLLDWRDSDDDPRPGGAETQHYLSRTPIGHEAKNAMLLTVEELLLVVGFDALSLWGEDANFNGTMEANENDGDESFPPDNGDGQLQRGLVSRFTAVTYEREIADDGKPRININGSTEDLAALDDSGLPEETIEFIRFARGRRLQFSHPVMLYELEYQGRSSGVGAEELPLVLSALTTDRSGGRSIRPGAVNVNTASREVLAALPAVGEELAGKIVETRSGLDSEQRNSAAWLVSEGLLEKAAFRNLSRSITGRSLQFRIRSVGYHRPSGQFCALEVIVDLGLGKPRILYLRELTRCGLPVIPGAVGSTVLGS